MENPLKRRDGARPAASLDVEWRPTDGPADRAARHAFPGLGNFFDWLRNPDRNTRRRPSPPRRWRSLLLLIIGLIALAFTAIRPNAGLPSDEQSAPNLSPHEKRLASKVAYRARRSADPAFRESESANVSSEWRRNNPDKARAQKARGARGRTIIAHSLPSTAKDRIIRATTLSTMASAIRGTTSTCGAQLQTTAGRPSWLMAAETRGLDKKPLSAIEILDWLLSLPAAIRTGDLHHFFRRLRLHADPEATFPTRRHGRSKNVRPTRTGMEKRWRIAHSPVLWKGYAISYIKGKSFDVWRLADPDKPYRGKKLHTTAPCPRSTMSSDSFSPHLAPSSKAWSTAAVRPRKKPISSLR